MDERQGSGRGIFFTAYRLLFVLLSFGIGLFFTIWGQTPLAGGSARYLLAGIAYLLIAVVLSRPQSIYVLPFTILTFLLTLSGRWYEAQLSYWGLIRLVVRLR